MAHYIYLFILRSGKNKVRGERLGGTLGGYRTECNENDDNNCG